MVYIALGEGEGREKEWCCGGRKNQSSGTHAKRESMVVSSHSLTLPVQSTPPSPKKIHPMEQDYKDRAMFVEKHR